MEDCVSHHLVSIGFPHPSRNIHGIHDRYKRVCDRGIADEQNGSLKPKVHVPFSITIHPSEKEIVMPYPEILDSPETFQLKGHS